MAWPRHLFVVLSHQVGPTVNPKTRSNSGADGALALRALRRTRLMQTGLALAAVTLTAGSAIITKRHMHTPTPLASVIADQLQRSSAAPNHRRDWHGIPAVSLVSHTPSTPAPITDPLLIDAAKEPQAPTNTAIAAPPAATPNTTTTEAGLPLLTPPAGYERYYNGRPLRRARTINMKVTAYAPDHRSCGEYADGITASGMSVWTNGMNLVAADPRILPRHSLITVPGYADNSVVPVLDVGGAIKGNRLDVLYPSHQVARQWGVQDLEVIIWEYADE